MFKQEIDRHGRAAAAVTMTPPARGARTRDETIEAFEARMRLLTELIDRLPFACVVLPADGSAPIVTAAAREIFEAVDGLTFDGVALRASRADATHGLRDAIATASRGASRALVSVSRPSGRTAYTVLATPLARDVAAPAAPVAVFIVDPEKQPEADEATLRAQYGLTRAEARLARVLLRGRTPEQAAEELSVSLATVRTHIARLLMKTGTSRYGHMLQAIVTGLGQLRVA